jgi:hypothetical protein
METQMPEIIYLPKLGKCTIVATSAASFKQRVRLTDLETMQLLFEKVSDGPTEPQSLGKVTIDATNPRLSPDRGYQIKVEIESSADNGKSWGVSRTRAIPGGAGPNDFCTICSEDIGSVDNDWNDAFVTVQLDFPIHNTQFQGLRFAGNENPDGND